MSTPNREHVIEFYKGTDYHSIRSGTIYRPSELHIPILLKRQEDVISEACKKSDGKKVIIPLTTEDCIELSPVVLHETLFHFYKAFYNYLAARSLYFGGMLHWIKITLYYSRFYFARSLTTLVGIQSYGVGGQDRFDIENWSFDERVSSALATKGKSVDWYRIKMDIDMPQKQGQITFDREKVNSHRDVWITYKSLNLEELAIYPIAYDVEDLREERNEENYSFDGYFQLDFNLYMNSFKDYFERDYLKIGANTLFDEESGNVLVALSSLYRLLKDLNVNDLPIEKEKFTHMIKYCLPNSETKDKLLMLCDEGFPTKTLNYDSGSEIWFDEVGRKL